VANVDDIDAMEMARGVKNKVITYGLTGEADLKATNIGINYENNFANGMSFKVEYKENVVPIFIKDSLGMQNISSSLCAIAVGISQNINIVKAGEGLLKHEAPKGRMRIVKGIKGSIILDDTYNASPVALESALNTIKEVETKGRKIALLGDMMELGIHSAEEHYEAGKKVADSCDVLFTVGVRSRKIVEGALDSKMNELNIFQFDNSIDAGKALQEFITEGDFILAKGSQSTRMERAVEEIMAEPEKASEMLVRQEEEWKKR